MAKNTSTEKTSTTTGKIAASVGAGLAAAGAAGYYFYASPRAKQHRKIATKWATKMKNDVVREAKRVKDMNAKDFAKVVDTVARTYSDVRSIDIADVKRAASELKSNWEMVQREVAQKSRKAVSRARGATKTATKTVAKAINPKSAPKARKSR